MTERVYTCECGYTSHNEDVLILHEEDCPKHKDAVIDLERRTA
jgi:hypothetical protein